MKGDARGHIGFDQTRNHINAGALGGQNQVNARGAGFLRQARNQLFDFFADHHHQIGQLVDDDDDMRQRLLRLGRVWGQAKGVGQQFTTSAGFVDFLVIARQIAHAHFAHQAVAAFHLVHAPIQAIGGLAHIGDDGAKQMRDAFVHAHLQHLGVDEHQAHLARLSLVQQAQNHGVDAHGFARACGARHQQMRHFGQIGHHRQADDVFAQSQSQ